MYAGFKNRQDIPLSQTWSCVSPFPSFPQAARSRQLPVASPFTMQDGTPSHKSMYCRKVDLHTARIWSHVVLNYTRRWFQVQTLTTCHSRSATTDCKRSESSTSEQVVKMASAIDWGTEAPNRHPLKGRKLWRLETFYFFLAPFSYVTSRHIALGPPKCRQFLFYCYHSSLYL